MSESDNQEQVSVHDESQPPALLSLPSEIRQLIYEHLFRLASFPIPENCTFNPGLAKTWRQYTYFGDGLTPTSRADNVLRTCKLIHREAKAQLPRNLTLRARCQALDTQVSPSALPRAILKHCLYLHVYFDRCTEDPDAGLPIFSPIRVYGTPELRRKSLLKARQLLPELTKLSITTSEAWKPSHKEQIERAICFCDLFMPKKFLVDNELSCEYNHTFLWDSKHRFDEDLKCHYIQPEHGERWKEGSVSLTINPYKKCLSRTEICKNFDELFEHPERDVSNHDWNFWGRFRAF